MRFRAFCLALLVVLVVAKPGAAQPASDPDPIFGFTAGLTGGAGRPEYVVATTADSSQGSLRSVLSEAGPSGFVRHGTTTPIDPLASHDAGATVLANAGARLPCRDTVDARIVTTVRTSAGKDVASGRNVSPPTPLPNPPLCEAPHP